MTHLACLVLAILMQAEPKKGDSPPDVVSALETALSDAIARAEPAVVAISRTKSEGGETLAVRGHREAGPAPPLNPFVEDFNPGPAETISLDYGAGVVIGPAGEILTAYHVVKGAARLDVRAAGKQQFEAEIIAADPRSDLAVIAPKVTPNLPMPKLASVTLGDATKLRKGSFLVALGNPYNAARDGQATAGWGILANRARSLQPPMTDLIQARQFQQVQLRHYPTLLQLDAKLNLGMSGGAVINLKGELVGLTTTGGDPAGFDGQAGYAVPIDALGRRIVETLRQGKEVEYGFLGVGLDKPPATNRITSVVVGTPADLANLRDRDVVVGVGDVPVSDSESLTLSLLNQPVGKPIKLRVQRGGEVLEKSIVLSKYPVQGPIIATNRPAPWRGLRVDFTSVMAGSSQEIIDAMSKGGVGITEVETGTEADAAGLTRGQVITAIDGRRVRTPGEFLEVVAKTRGPVKLDTDRGPITVKP